MLRPKALAHAIRETLGSGWDVHAHTTGDPKDATISVAGKIAGKPIRFRVNIHDHKTPESAADAVIEALGKHGMIAEADDGGAQ